MENRECRYAKASDLFNSSENIQKAVDQIISGIKKIGLDHDLRRKLDQISKRGDGLVHREQIVTLIAQLESAGYSNLVDLMQHVMDNFAKNFRIAGEIYAAENFDTASEILQVNIGTTNLDGQVFNAMLRKADGDPDAVERVKSFRPFADLEIKKLPLGTMFKHLPETFDEEAFEKLRGLTQGAKILPLSNSQRRILIPGLADKYREAPQNFKDLVTGLYLFIGEEDPFS